MTYGGYSLDQLKQSTLVTDGEVHLVGDHEPVINKNGILKEIVAACLTSEDVVYPDLPPTSDVARMLQLLQVMGCDVRFDEATNTTYINSTNLNTTIIDRDIGQEFRSSVLLVGALLARFGEAWLPVPGGCDLGDRGLGTHINVFRQLGCEITFTDGYIHFKRPKIIEPAYEIWMVEPSVTATESALLYMALTEADFTVMNAACEPHVVDLCTMLENMGVGQIYGKMSNRLQFRGKNNLSGTTAKTGPDPIDIGGAIIGYAMTQGEGRILGANEWYISGGLVQYFRNFGIIIEKDGQNLYVKAPDKLMIKPEYGFPTYSTGVNKFYPGPWGNFPTDLIPNLIALCGLTDNKIMGIQSMYEHGLVVVPVLKQLGADMELLNNMLVAINCDEKHPGPRPYKGAYVRSPDVIQSAYAILMAGLSAIGKTEIENWHYILRRYPFFIENLNNMGANIKIQTW